MAPEFIDVNFRVLYKCSSCGAVSNTKRLRCAACGIVLPDFTTIKVSNDVKVILNKVTPKNRTFNDTIDFLLNYIVDPKTARSIYHDINTRFNSYLYSYSFRRRLKRCKR